MHGDPRVGGKRGITLNSGAATIANSWISDIKSATQDSQTICGWNGSGPYLIENNYLEASGENIMFGGAVPKIPNLVPSDITIRRNHFFKPLSWKKGDPSFTGTTWIVKNLFELKNARRVLLEGNVFENNWTQAQPGFGIVLTTATEGGVVKWAVVEDVTFRNNVMRNMFHGINIRGIDGTYGKANRISFVNNVFENISGGRFLQLLNGANYVTVDHNTVFHATLLVCFDGSPSTGLVYKNNLSNRGTYGIFTSYGEGTTGLAVMSPGAVVTKNVIAGATARLYPAGNYFPATLSDVQFMDSFGGNYALKATSPYLNLGTDGKNLGADIAAVTAATASVVLSR
jgi:hypothetical protein